MSNQLNIVTILKTGGDFSLSDVDLLTRNLKGRWPVVCVYCITDAVGVPRMSDEGCSLIPMGDGNRHPGWWAKMNMFSPTYKPLRPFLYLDLDTAVVDTLEGIVPSAKHPRFIMLRDFYKPQKPASGMMWVPSVSKKLTLLWETWEKRKALIMRKYRGDQDFIASVCKPDEYWQDITDKISSFKPVNANKQWLVDLPNHINVVCFHGKPRIPAAARQVDWVERYIKAK